MNIPQNLENLSKNYNVFKKIPHEIENKIAFMIYKKNHISLFQCVIEELMKANPLLFNHSESYHICPWEEYEWADRLPGLDILSDIDYIDLDVESDNEDEIDEYPFDYTYDYTYHYSYSYPAPQ